MGDLVAAGQIDPSEGLIELKVNGAVRQPFDLSNMIWNVPETLALSLASCLVPGRPHYDRNVRGFGARRLDRNNRIASCVG
jgi:hypothetical protein